MFFLSALGGIHPQTGSPCLRDASAVIGMPTQKECHVCKKKIGVASKTCGHCGAKQPYKQKLEKIKKKLAHGWKERQKKNSSVNKVYDATNLLLHKWELLERHPMLLLARRTTNGFLAECFCPWQMNAQDTKDALVTIKRIYESLLNVTVPAEPAAEMGGPPAADGEEPPATQTETPPPDQHVLPANTDSTAAPLLRPELDTEFTFVLSPGSSSLASPVPSSSQIPPDSSPSSLTRPVSSASPTPPVSSSLASPVSSALSVSSKLSSPVSTRLDTPDSLSSSWKRAQARRKLDPSECPIHQGSSSFPYKQILGERIREGRAEVLLQWYPCSGCGAKWKNTWEPKENILS
ncbi:flocculation protein FLO11-like isoform X3 [Xiphias gladius]|uniref:flocculation protein FLO11-like isoform X3 n=1 Tax=Xiphias gladius TaxID=8245 RepID=UPI001A99CB51|nr:flocculation protein FLO11-like isoform X3 [Xiphias gladius]